jgi:UDP-glucose:tetrahydrobiopterin glucosyltransferase
MLRVLLVSTPVGALGSGLEGGIELTLRNFARALADRGHQVKILAPTGSRSLELNLQEVAGTLQPSMQIQDRHFAIAMPENSVLANLWDIARQGQKSYDLILNFAYDWLPFYLTPFFQTPVLHLVSMGSLTATIDRVILQTLERFPHSLAFYTASQAATFGLSDYPHCLSSAVDLSLYQFCDRPDRALAWIGRISPEKALEDAVEAAYRTGIPLRIFGKIQDPDYWQSIKSEYPDPFVDYRGFLKTDDLQREVGRCRALLMTPRWVEAFGNVAIEALACGVPVIAYRRGGPAEIVQPEKTGFLVEPDSIEGLVQAIYHIDEINRLDCRQQAEQVFSLKGLGDRLEQWFQSVLQ